MPDASHQQLCYSSCRVVAVPHRNLLLCMLHVDSSAITTIPFSTTTSNPFAATPSLLLRSCCLFLSQCVHDILQRCPYRMQKLQDACNTSLHLRTQLESTHQCKLPRALASPEGPCQAVQLRQKSLRLQQCVKCGGQLPQAGSVSEASVTMHVLDMHRCLCMQTGLPATGVIP